jgi:flagellar hook-associated protein 3 FlgL
MSAISSATGIGGTLGLLVGNSVAINNDLSVLTEQASSGLIAQSYAGLGAGAVTSLSLSPVLASQQIWRNNIGAATGVMQVAQTALTQIGSAASNFYAQIPNLNGLNPSNIDNIAASARSALQQVAGLLDSTDGGNYVFAGQDSANPPVPDPDNILSSGFFTQIQSAVGNLATSGASAVTSTTLAVASSNDPGTSPFSAALSQPAAALANFRASVSVGQGQAAPTVMLASTNGDVASTGSSTTGSYMRDILRALATLGSLSSSQADTPGFSQVVSDTYASLGGAITALNSDAGVMGDRQSQVQSTQTDLSDTSTALQSQVSSAQDVDMAATLSKITQTQTQLQASYQLIAEQQKLTLVSYLTGA